MKVMIVARGYPTKKYKMNGIFEFDQAKALAKAGVNVLYVAVDVRSIRRWRRWGIEKKILDGVNVYSINIPCGRLPKGIIDKIKVWSLKYIHKVLRKEHGEPDLIHAHFIGSGYTTIQVFEKNKIPLILTEHYSEMNKKELSDYYEKVGKFTYARMDKVIAVSDYLANNIKDKFDVDVSTVPNIVDLSNFQYEGNTNSSKSKGYSFISVGSLNSNKRMDLLIETFSDVFKNKKNATLYIFGEGPDRPKLEKLIDDLDLKSQVFLLGLVNRSEIATQMRKSDCFVLVSELETFGVAYIEALAMGLPVIASRCGGPEEFVNESNGVLVEVDKPKALSKAMMEMYEGVNCYNRDSIARDILEEFGPDSVVDLLMNEYNQVLEGKCRE